MAGGTGPRGDRTMGGRQLEGRTVVATETEGSQVVAVVEKEPPGTAVGAVAGEAFPFCNGQVDLFHPCGERMAAVAEIGSLGGKGEPLPAVGGMGFARGQMAGEAVPLGHRLMPVPEVVDRLVAAAGEAGIGKGGKS